MIKLINIRHLEIPNNPDIKWIQLTKPDEETIQQVLERYKFPYDFVKSGLDPYELPRTETYETEDGVEYSLFVFLIPYIDEDALLTEMYQVFPLSVVISEDIIITICAHEIDDLVELLDREWEEDFDEYSFLLRIFWHVSQSYIKIITYIDTRITALEQTISRSTQNRINYELIGINKGLVYFASGIHGNRKIMRKLENTSHKWSSSSSQTRLLRNAQIEHQQADEMIDQSQEIIRMLTDLLNNVINNNMNKIMKVLTIWSIIINVPMLISGIWGMNVDLPFQNSPYALWVIAIITLVLAVVAYWFLDKHSGMN